MVEVVVGIGGEAGQGIAKAAEIIAKTAAKMGLYAFDYRDYQSLIRGGLNYNIVKISDEPVLSHEWEVDLLAILSPSALELKKFLKDSSVVLSALPGQGDIEIKPEGFDKRALNMAAVGAIVKYLGLNRNFAIEEIEKIGKFVEENKKAFEYGEAKIEQGHSLVPKENVAHYYISGSEAVAMGAIASGIDLYIAYPMTPATPVLHILASLQDEFDFRAIQMENEIAVINSALGASYAGAKVMIGTSGGGMALMSEAMSLQGMSEVPLVFYLAMRTGPSTGVPTYTDQGDIRFAMHAGHGYFPRVVVAPGDPAEAFEKTVEAFTLAYKYRVLSIIASDKHVAESHYTLKEMPFVSDTERYIIRGPMQGFKSYQITEDGISPRSIPMWAFPVRATSYEHDEYGITVEEAEKVREMADKRLRKAATLKKAVRNFTMFKEYGDGKIAVVGWGSTKGAIVDALKLANFKFYQVLYLEPFPEELADKLVEHEKVIVVENSAGCFIDGILREKTGIKADGCIKKYDARPFSPKEIAGGVKKWM